MIPLGYPPRRMLLSIVIGCILMIVPASSTRGAPAVLADFRFTGNGNDDAGNSPPMDLTGVPFFNGTLYFAPSNAFASARINGFSYSSFTVSVDFNPCNSAAENRTFARCSYNPHHRGRTAWPVRGVPKENDWVVCGRNPASGTSLFRHSILAKRSPHCDKRVIGGRIHACFQIGLRSICVS